MGRHFPGDRDPFRRRIVVYTIEPPLVDDLQTGDSLDFTLTGHNFDLIPHDAYLSIFTTKESAISNIDWDADEPRFGSHYAEIVYQSESRITFRLTASTRINYPIYPYLIVSHDIPRTILYEIDNTHMTP